MKNYYVSAKRLEELKEELHELKTVRRLEVAERLKRAKEYGFSDRQLGKLLGKSEQDISDLRKSLNIIPDFKLVDTCAAEFQAYTPYFYSTYDK